MNKKLLFIFSIIFLPNVVFGQEIGSIQQLLAGYNFFIDVWIMVLIFLSVIFFLAGMASFMLNPADEQKRAAGKQKMIWGIIALAMMIGVWGIVKIIQLATLGTTVPGFPDF